jgi:hypothetical protein
MENFNWEEIKEKLAKAVKLEKNKADLSVKIIIKELDIEENQIIGNILKSEKEMKQSLAQFINQGKPVNCEVEVNQDEKFILLKFNEIKMWQKTYEFFNDFFFGDYLKKMIEAMMGAFGGIFGKDD